MTEVEWLACTDPAAMLARLRRQDAAGASAPYAGGSLPRNYMPGKSLISERKLKLFVEQAEWDFHRRRRCLWNGQYSWTVLPDACAAAVECLRIHNLPEDQPPFAAILRDIA